MCTCEFCGTLFSSRPQTKNPIACKNSSCQKERQSKNERDWHKRNRDLYLKNAKYHQEQRIERHRTISQLTGNFLEAIYSGFTLKGICVDHNLFKFFFSDFMWSVGLRKINKFCNDKKSFISTTLATNR